MKKLLLTSTVVALTLSVTLSQPPQSVNYQGIARDNSGNALVSQIISLQISILSGSSTGTVVYSETHSATTNQFGLFTLEIGNGTVIAGNFTTIDWGGNNYYLQVEMDESGGTNYLLMGTSQLLSVPYAFYAENVKNDSVDDADSDPSNELQALSISNDTLYLSNGGTVYLGIYLDNTDTQNLALSGDTLSISGGNSVTLTDNVDDADSDSTNELQALSFSNDTLFLSMGNYVVLPSGTGSLNQMSDVDTTGLQVGSILQWNGIDWVTASICNFFTFYFPDRDNDGTGDKYSAVFSCFPLPGYVTDSSDCNDNDSAIYVGAIEICDNIDNNCDGQVDEGFTDGTPCDDSNPCTTGDVYNNCICIGTPVICDDGNPCTADSCDVGTGGCISTPVICDDGNECTIDLCDTGTGNCLNSPVPNSTLCSFPTGGECIGGNCICTGGLTDCFGVCVDTATDDLNCGGCGNVCPFGQSCVAGTCQ